MRHKILSGFYDSVRPHLVTDCSVLLTLSAVREYLACGISDKNQNKKADEHANGQMEQRPKARS
jgi:hypothetical protein